MGWVYFGMLVTFVGVSIGYSIYLDDFEILLWSGAALVLFAIISLLGALINVAIFPPIFRLLARLVGKQKGQRGNGKRE
jgi:hypothetical protein